MRLFSLVVNNVQHRIHAPAEMPLLWALRDLLHLTGTKYGCSMGVCGACTVHEDGSAVRSCQISLSASTGKRYTTIEGLSVDGSHPCQRSWLEEDVSQCGYCQAGMIMEAAALIRRKPNLSDAEIDSVMSDHVCRCGTFQRLRRAIRRASREVSKT